MIVFLNGRFVPEDQAVVSVFDRGFLYGDGLFETFRICNGQPFRWAQHIERLQRGAERLRLRLPFPGEALRSYADELIRVNQMPESILRLNVSRGAGPRGYSTARTGPALVVLSLHPAPAIDPRHPPQWRLLTSSLRLSANDPLATIKTCNKLLQVLARAEVEERGADEALLLNAAGEVVETTNSNVFWIENSTVSTPPVEDGALAGVTRAVVLELCPALGLPCQEKSARLETLHTADGVFLTLSTLGIVEAISLDGEVLRRSPLVATLQVALQRTLQEETHLTSDSCLLSPEP